MGQLAMLADGALSVQGATHSAARHDQFQPRATEVAAVPAVVPISKGSAVDRLVLRRGEALIELLSGLLGHIDRTRGTHRPGHCGDQRMRQNRHHVQRTAVDQSHPGHDHGAYDLARDKRAALDELVDRGVNRLG